MKLYPEERTKAITTNATIIVRKRERHYCVMNLESGTLIADGFLMKHDAEAYAKFIRDQQPQGAKIR